MRRPWMLALFAAAACGDDGTTSGIPVPSTGTDYIVWATAPAGRAANPQSVRVARTGDVTTLEPDTIGGGDADMFFAGLAKDDLPAGIDPTALEFVSDDDERAHELPKLYAPHVLNDPTAAGRSARFVPADDTSAPLQLREERDRRFRAMINGLAIKDPCVEPLSPITIIAPRTPGEDIRSFRTLSSGETFAALSATSTAIIGVVRHDTLDLEVIGVGTGTVAMIRQGDRTRINDLGDTEARDANGRLIPGEVSINLIGAFGGLGTLSSFDPVAKRYDDDTILLPEGAIVPGLIAGARHVTLDGVSSLCVYGAARGANRIAGIWCRAVAPGSPWSVSGQFREAFTVIAMTARPPPLPPIAVDVVGTAYAYDERGWHEITRTALNDGCMPPCVTFSSGAEGPSYSVLGGSHAQLLTIQTGAGGDVDLGSLEIVDTVLFADERRGAEMPLRYSSAAFAPDGSLWLGSQKPILLRVGADQTTPERICLPKDARGAEITAIEAHPSGRLYLGMTPALLGFGDWRQ